ncbi:MAG: hypothetical protein ACYCV4_15445, partial [Dermatophilaceae bacterium]
MIKAHDIIKNAVTDLWDRTPQLVKYGTALGATGLVLSGCGTAGNAGATAPTTPDKLPASSAPVTPGATENTAAVGRFDPSKTAEMTADEIRSYYLYDPADVTSASNIAHAYADRLQGSLMIGCADNILKPFGYSLTVDDAKNL